MWMPAEKIEVCVDMFWSVSLNYYYNKCAQHVLLEGHCNSWFNFQVTFEMYICGRSVLDVRWMLASQILVLLPAYFCTLSATKICVFTEALVHVYINANLCSCTRDHAAEVANRLNFGTHTWPKDRLVGHFNILVVFNQDKRLAFIPLMLASF